MRGALSRMLNHSPAIKNKKLKRMCKIYLSEERMDVRRSMQSSKMLQLYDNENSLG